MTTSADPTRRFTSDMLAGLDEPVRRYFSNAISDGAALPNGVRVAMRGRIQVGLWLPFTAEQTVDGRSHEVAVGVRRGACVAAAAGEALAGEQAGAEARGVPSADR